MADSAADNSPPAELTDFLKATDGAAAREARAHDVSVLSEHTNW